ncbi:MAG: tyrosine-type recombinase/integrase [Victivallales bacterium]|nr:tyrosine-type recombinase/integrase [Victivallales bacterium]
MARRRAKGSGTIIKDKRTGIFYFRWFDDNGVKRKKSLRTKNKQEAEGKVQGFVKAIQAKDKHEVLFQAAKAREIIKSRDLPLNEIWPEFLKTKPTAGAGTLKLYERVLNGFIKWLATERPSISSFTQIEHETAISYMEQVWQGGISASTYNDKRNALGHITKKLANKFGIDNNYWSLTECKRGVKQKRLPLSRTHVKELLNNLDKDNNLPYSLEMACLFKLCLFAGMRLGDAVKIKWENIDFETAYLSYIPEKTARTSGVKATIPLLPPLQQALNKLSSIRGDNEQILPQVYNHYNRNPDYIKEKLLIALHSVTGDTRQEGKAQSKRKRALYGVHSLRHTFVTEAAKAGLNSVQLSRMTGDRISTLDKFYIEVDLNKKPISGFNNILPRENKQIAEEPEREQLKQLVDTLPLERVKEVLRQITQ